MKTEKQIIKETVKNTKALATKAFENIKKRFDRVHSDLLPIEIKELEVYTCDGLQGYIKYETEFFTDSDVRDFEEIMGKKSIYTFYVFPINSSKYEVELGFSIRGL